MAIKSSDKFLGPAWEYKNKLHLKQQLAFVCVCVRVLSVITNSYFIFVYFVCLVCNSALETRNETQTSN